MSDTVILVLTFGFLGIASFVVGMLIADYVRRR